MTTKGFNFSELEARAMEQLRAGKSLLGSEGALTPLIKHFTEAALRAELDAHLANEQSDTNRKNGKTTKKMRSGYGTFELDTPRDRASSFEPQLRFTSRPQIIRLLHVAYIPLESKPTDQVF